MSGSGDNIAGLQFGEYIVGQALGRRGVGVTYEASQPFRDRAVAVKVLELDVGDDPTFGQRFERELRLVAQLRHPHIVDVLDCRAAHGYYYIVTELVRGNTLREAFAHLRARDEWLASGAALDIVSQCGLALSYAHQHGFLHRDVTPDTILIGEHGEVALADFGLVYLLGEKALSTPVVGTPPYCAPEQYAYVEPVGPAADQYALAVVAYELLTGRTPFTGATAPEIVNQQLNQLPPLPSSVDPTLPPACDAVLLRALARDTDERYASVDEFVRQLKAALTPATSIADIPLSMFDEDPTNDDSATASTPSAASAGAVAVTVAAATVAPREHQQPGASTGAETVSVAAGAATAAGVVTARDQAAAPASTDASVLGAISSVGRRAAATVLDLVFIFFTFLGMGGLVSAAEGASSPIACGWLLFFVLYYPLMERYVGATVGKLVLGLRVVREDGSTLDWQSVIVRTVLRVVDGIGFYLVGAILAWISPKNQRLGDLAGKTLVVNKRELALIREI